MTLTNHEGLTLADLESMPDDGRRYELLGGTIVVNGAPRPRHQRASARLHQLLLAATPPGHEVFYSLIDLDLPDEQRVEPDLVIVPTTSVGEERLSLPVLLVVELLSRTALVWDTIAKRDAYARAGIGHYWMIDTRPGHERFTACRLPDDADAYDVVVDDTNRVTAAEPIDIDVSLSDLFTPPR